MQPQRPPTDTRKLHRDMNRGLLGLVLFVLVVGGGLFIALIYGPEAAAFGLICLFAGAVIIVLLWLVFTLLQKWVGED
jgi:hypothetical protein